MKLKLFPSISSDWRYRKSNASHSIRHYSRTQQHTTKSRSDNQKQAPFQCRVACQATPSVLAFAFCICNGYALYTKGPHVPWLVDSLVIKTSVSPCSRMWHKATSLRTSFMRVASAPAADRGAGRTPLHQELPGQSRCRRSTRRREVAPPRAQSKLRPGGVRTPTAPPSDLH